MRRGRDIARILQILYDLDGWRSPFHPPSFATENVVLVISRPAITKKNISRVIKERFCSDNSVDGVGIIKMGEGSFSGSRGQLILGRLMGPDKLGDGS